MEARVKCARCGANILGVTAKYNGGQCAPCWAQRPELVRQRRRKAWLEEVRFWLMLPLWTLALPFLVVRELLKYAWRRWKFPYSLGPVRKRLKLICETRREVRIYLRGLIRGYHQPGYFMLPPDPRDLAKHAGQCDGRDLREGRITFEELPRQGFPLGPHLEDSSPKWTG
jgi:hypothetical protein